MPFSAPIASFAKSLLLPDWGRKNADVYQTPGHVRSASGQRPQLDKQGGMTLLKQDESNCLLSPGLPNVMEFTKPSFTGAPSAGRPGWHGFTYSRTAPLHDMWYFSSTPGTCASRCAQC